MATPTTFELDLTGDEALSRALTTAAPVLLVKHLHAAMVDAGSQWEVAMKRRFTGFATGVRKRDGLFNRSGSLRRSIRVVTTKGKTVSELNQAMNVGGAEASYARAQEFGAVVKPRLKRFLTVPLPAALTPSGVLRGGARLYRKGKGYATDMGPTFIRRGPSGQPIIFLDRGQTKGGRARKPVPLYVLKRQVTIPGPTTTGGPSRLGAIDTAQLTPHRMRFFEFRLRRAVEGIAAESNKGARE